MSQFNSVSIHHLVDKDDFVKKVNFELSLVNKSFFEIGKYLHEAQKRGFYLQLGFHNIIDCSESLFGFKKTITYDLINVYRFFHVANGDIDVSVKHLPQSHLIALLPCQAGRNSLGSIIQPSDKVEDVKRAVKVYNRLSINQRSTFKSENLKDFLEEFDYPGSSSIVRSGSSAQAEKNVKSNSPDPPVCDLWSDVCDCVAIQSHLEAAIDHMSRCFDECNIGSSFRNDVIEAHNNLKVLLDKFIH